MTDISKCANTTCPLRQSCFRAIATESPAQSWCMFEYKYGQNGIECDFYWPVFEISTSNKTSEEQ